MKIYAEDVPLIEIDQPISPETCLKLTKTNTIGGLKCEHYEKDGMQLRVFYKNNGDYFVTNEDPDGMNREPNDDNQALGMWRISNANCTMIGGFEYPYIKWKYPEYRISCSRSNEKFKDELEVYTKQTCIIQDSKGNQSYYMYTDSDPTYTQFLDGTLPNMPISFIGVRLASDGLKVFYPNGFRLLDYSNTIAIDHDEKICYAMTDDWFYIWDYTKGELGTSFAQIYGELVVPVNHGNKVTKIIDEKKGKKVIYENGDWIICGTNFIMEGKLHIGKDVLVIKSDDRGRIIYDGYRIEYADGSIFSGTIKIISKDGKELEHDVSTLQADKLEPVTGTMQDAQGNLTEYVDGKKKEKLTNTLFY